MRIAVYQAGALGDMLLTFPALDALRKQWPDAHIKLICRADVHALALASGLADRTLNHALAAWTCLFANSVSPSDLAREIFAGADLALVWAQDAEGEIVSRLNALGSSRRWSSSRHREQGHGGMRRFSYLIRWPRWALLFQMMLPRFQGYRLRCNGHRRRRMKPTRCGSVCKVSVPGVQP